MRRTAPADVALAALATLKLRCTPSDLPQIAERRQDIAVTRRVAPLAAAGEFCETYALMQVRPLRRSVTNAVERREDLLGDDIPPRPAVHLDQDAPVPEV